MPGPGGGVPDPGGGVGAWSRGGGCLILGGAWSWGVPGPGGVALSRGGCLVETPHGRLLLRAVRILLECILVYL